MTQYHLIEDKFPKKLPTLLSYDIANKIELIKGTIYLFTLNETDYPQNTPKNP